MPETLSPQDLEGLSLEAIARLVAEQRLPPVAQWNPKHCGHSGMRILRDGTWLHEGSPIGRPAMVRLFSSILRREPEGGFVLVTPVEKLDIDVEDAPFVAVAVHSEGMGQTRRLAFRLNTGDPVVADAAHPLWVDQRDDGPHPYVRVRDGLDALIGRAVYYELVNLALEDEGPVTGVWSEGHFFALEPQT